MQAITRVGRQLCTHTTAGLRLSLPRTVAGNLRTYSYVATQSSPCVGAVSLKTFRFSDATHVRKNAFPAVFVKGFCTSGNNGEREKVGAEAEKVVQEKEEGAATETVEESVVEVEDKAEEEEFKILECGKPETVDGLLPLRDVRQETPNDVKVVWDLLRSENCRDLVAIDVRPRTNHTDYFVIATCRSARHAKAVATEIVRQFKGSRRKGLDLNVEGGGTDGWMVVNMSDIHVHLMELSARKTYELEKLWLLGNQDDQLKAAREADRRSF